VLLLEDLDLLTKTRTGEKVSRWTQTTEVGRLAELAPSFRRGKSTHVPGFWSWKGFRETVLTLMMCICECLSRRKVGRFRETRQK